MSIQKNEKLFFPVIKIYYALVSEITSITDQADGTVVVVFEATKDWKLLYASRKSIVYGEPMKQVNEGIIYIQSIELKNPGDDLDNNIAIDDLAKQKLIFKLVFTENESKILGDLDNPAKLLANFKYGDLSTARTVKIRRESSYPAPYIST